MAVPKKKVSRARRDKRRLQCMEARCPGVEPVHPLRRAEMPHRVCPMCGYYKGKEILKVEA
jgi:large subunit ribosomal protein L32